MHKNIHTLKQLAVGLCLLAVGCSDSDRRNPASFASSGESFPVVARVGERPITAEELDESLKLPLYDLEFARYELRRKQLLAMVEAQRAAGAVEILLPVPEPPRVKLPESARSVRGNPEAPVTIAVFCSYESPHCKAIQPAMRRLASEYAGWTRQQLFDLPLKFHRQGVSAATAARCAERQGALWRYQDGLYAFSRSLDDDVYRRLAEQAGLNTRAFRRCMREKPFAEAIGKDRQFAQGLGLTSVPVVFINGLYLRGPQPFSFYAGWVERELNRLGFDRDTRHSWTQEQATRAGLPQTDLPLTLVGVSLSSAAEDSRALLKVRDSRARSMAVTAQVMPGVLLAEIHHRFVVIDNRGRKERLPLKGEAGDSPVPLTATRERSPEALRRIEQPQGAGSRKLVEPDGVLPLGQQWLAEQLQNRAALEKKFVQAEMEVEGYHLMRLEGIASNEFFTALGFEENDVLLRVNDSWVHSGQNNLWEALTSGDVVDVAFMRRGLPQRLQYVVEEIGYFEEAAEDTSGDDSEDENGEGEDG